MAAAKKTVKPVAVASATTAPKAETKKVETPAAEVKAETKKVEAPAAAKAEKPVAAKKETVKKPAAKKETVKKAPAKKVPAKRGPAKKADLKSEVHIQFSGKSYTQDELVKIAKDVWKFDLKQKVSELSSIELYVKPEEKVAYYVMNREFTGSFGI